MFDTCHTLNGGPKCTEVAEKIVSLFGWRQTYNVEKLQRNVPGRATTRISITRPSPNREKPPDGKGADSWVSVHNLQSQGGGILDPDDRLSDVADDREQILASFEDGEGAHLHGGGDGASGSSVGTGSPDIFHDGEHKYGPNYPPRTDIEVTGEQIASGVPLLQVRRGSEPTLNQLPAGPPAAPEHTKRWSAAPLILEPPSSGYASPDWMEDSREEEEEPGFRRVARDGSNRLSMQFLGADGAGYRWAEAAERAATARSHVSTSLPRESRRKEPLGQANNSTSPLPSSADGGELIVIRNEPGPLGIHVIPDYDTLGRERGLLVKGIEPGGRIDRDGRLAIYDRVIEINGENLINMPFQRLNFRVQELFKLSLTSPELRLKVIKASGLEGLRKPPPPIYPCFPEDKEKVSMVECEQKQSTNTKVATVSPTKKVPAISKNLKGLLTANTRKIGRKIEIELVKGPHGLGFSITTRDNPAGGKCPIYIKNINAVGPAIEDGRLRIGDRLLEVNNAEMTGKSQAEAVALLKSLPLGSKVRIVVSRQEDVVDTNLPRIIDVEHSNEREVDRSTDNSNIDVPPNIPPLPQSHLQALQNRTPDKGSVAKIISQFQEAVNNNSPLDQMEESMVFPWKHREILTFNIPVHDSEKAGLGISVKGKTSGSKDLGIFIKGVMFGGAASRDNRLRTNDQLLNVNGISLLQMSNSDAMETLKNAIPHTEGPVPGHITLTIARKASSPGSNRNYRNKSSDNLLITSNSASELYQSQDKSDSVDNSGASGGSTNTVIFNPQGGLGNVSDCKSPSNQLSPMHTWNPVLERLTGNTKQLRNESYCKATHDTWTSSMLGNSSFGNLTSTTVNMTNVEPILIEDEYGSRVVPHQNQHAVPENRNDHEPDGKASLSGSNGDKSTDTSSQTTIQANDATYASQLSLENPQGFSRDAFGRQSMSEKRHATLDAKSTDTYQRSKKMREERRSKDTSLVRVGSVESVISINRSAEHPEYADKLGQLGPSLGMKKSSSLESLQTMVQEIQMQEEGDPAYSYRGPSGALKVIRGRGCEESFRAAVVDPNHTSEIGAKKHWLLDGPMENEREIDGFNNVRGAPRQSSLNAALDSKIKSSKKKPGILKGIGSMFRFGKHRKMEFVNAEPVQHYHHSNEFDSNANPAPSQNPPENDTQPHHNDNQSQGSQSERLQEQLQQPPRYSPHQQPPQANLQQQNALQQQQQQNVHHQANSHQQPGVQQQIAHKHHHQSSHQPHSREQQIQREAIYQRHGFVHRHAEQVQVIPENSVAPPPIKYRQNSSEHRRNERDLNKLRMNQQRHTYYQNDERDAHDHRQAHQRSDSRDPQYIEYGRPGSRSGITESIPYTHYVNYKELQSHLSRKDPLSESQIVQMRLQVQQQRLKVEEESRKQHQYHSQRQTRTDNQLRPVSNYYEYESVQSVLNSRSARPNVSHTPQQQPPPIYQDANSNSLPRNQPVVQGRHPTGRGSAHRGPFITQVTIGEQNGTKV
ncbi:partitioning defective 3 homolog isoform X3 [Anoplophora glabripennis]|uniref:partitioning defective 3 homolog isoform X3 n=1 Tax=Anoplophora glabripennis TaxID=217634 RepID=UPI000873F155|nr:partitioning defective 3 homolog isoform X3 [Anoplophora glabripennis]